VIAVISIETVLWVVVNWICHRD